MSKLRPYQLAAFKHMVAQMEQQELAAYITDVVEHSSDDVVDAVYGMFCTDSSLPRTVDLFTKVNEDCAKSGEQVVPFSNDPSVVDFYMEQMDNLDIFSPEEMEEFKSFLQSMPA